MGIVQDALLSAHLLTEPGVLLTRAEMMRYAAWIRHATPSATGGQGLVPASSAP